MSRAYQVYGTAYQVHESGGLPVKRVDVDPSSATHNGIPTPHVEPFVQNTTPNGKTFINTAPDRTRPARPEAYSRFRDDL